MKAKEFIPQSKPRNFVAKNAMKTTSGAGSHKDKKKEQKQGYEKHKGKDIKESSDEFRSEINPKSMKFNQLLYWIRNDIPVPSPRLRNLVMKNGKFLDPDAVKELVKKGELWSDYGWDQPGYNYKGIAEDQTIPKGRYNDDDFYAYDTETMELKKSWSSKERSAMFNEKEAKEKGWNIKKGSYFNYGDHGLLKIR